MRRILLSSLYAVMLLVMTGQASAIQYYQCCRADADGDGVSHGATAQSISCPAGYISAGPLTHSSCSYVSPIDNCPYVSNNTQTDGNGDGVGDDCQGDKDSDTVADAADNCPTDPNTNQADVDGDTQGNACDTDDDNDGVLDTSDACPLDNTASTGNNDGDAQCNLNDPDDDNDTVLDGADNCPMSANADQANADGDAQGNGCDTDDDNDGVLDASDACPLDNTASTGNLDGDTLCDVTDLDDDNDAMPDGMDNCPVVANADQLDTDGDALGNACDTDDDNDGVADGSDPFPLDAAETLDTDADGTGNNADTDDDNDALADGADNCPLATNADQADMDDDTVGDVCDSDKDGDGVANTADEWPADNRYVYDLDRDTLPDVWEVANGRNPTVADYAIGSNCQKDETGGTCAASTNLASKEHIYASAWQCARFTMNHIDYRYTPSATGVLAQSTSYIYTNYGSTSYCSGPTITTSAGATAPAAYLVQFTSTVSSFCFLDRQGKHCYTYNGSLTAAAADMVIDSDGDGIQRPADTDDLTPLDTDGDGIADNADAFPNDDTQAGDVDSDGVDAFADNCPGVTNAGQSNNDSDTWGDACDLDDDNDGIYDVDDRFPVQVSVSVDSDSDGVADSWNAACDASCQGSSGLVLDNCPSTANADQLNTDGDTQGDACDTDDDNDGLADTDDAYPLDNTQAGDVDGDGLDGFFDNCPGLANADQLNTDGDAQGNVCDTDDDNDGVADTTDKFPLNSAASVDEDLDGVPTSWNAACDVTCQANSALVLDNCPYTANADQLNTDGDAQGNVCDTDDDNDGVADASDAFPLNALELVDTDGDGIGNNSDPDDDGDGLADGSDNCPLINNPGQRDDDSDAVGNPCDADGPGKRDVTSNPGSGADNLPLALAVQPDGKALLGGFFSSINGTIVNRIARLNADGSVDAGFNPGSGPNNTLYVLVVQSDGKVLLGGDFTTINGTARNRIARLNFDGSLDAGFNPGSGSNSTVRVLAVQSDGKVLLGGDFTTINGTARNRIARLNLDGSLDSGFNPGNGANDRIYSLVVQPDGKVLLGGLFTSINGMSRKYIARINVDGSVDTSFNPGSGADNSVTTLKLQQDGKILLGGSFTSFNGVSRNRIARLNADGSVDASFNPGSGADNVVYTIALQADGMILLGGNFTSVNGASINRVARLNAEGSVDSGFNPGSGANNYVNAIAIQPDGKALLSGYFTTYDGASANYFTRIHTGDRDHDGIEDGADIDSDNDGVVDTSDAFPFNMAESADNDHDGVGNNADLDDDNDGVPDYIDAEPQNAANTNELVLPLNNSYKGSQLKDQMHVQ